MSYHPAITSGTFSQLYASEYGLSGAAVDIIPLSPSRLGNREGRLHLLAAIHSCLAVCQTVKLIDQTCKRPLLHPPPSEKVSRHTSSEMKPATAFGLCPSPPVLFLKTIASSYSSTSSPSNNHHVLTFHRNSD